MYDLANCSLFATFVLQVKDLEEKVYSLETRWGPGARVLTPLWPRLGLSLEVCVESNGRQKEGQREGEEEI